MAQKKCLKQLLCFELRIFPPFEGIMKCLTHFMFLSFPIVNLVYSHLSILHGIRSDILDKHETIFAFLFNCLNSSLSNTGQIFEEAFAVIIQIQNDTHTRKSPEFTKYPVWCLLCELFLVKSKEIHQMLLDGFCL